MIRLFQNPMVAAEDPETATLTMGQLMQAAVNTDIVLTAGVNILSAADKALFESKATLIDDAMAARGYARYADL